MSSFRFEDDAIKKDGIQLNSQVQIPAGTVYGSNSVVEGGFEDYWNYISHTPDNWNEQGTPTLYNYIERTTDTHLGTYSARIFHNELDNVLSQGITCSTGHVITFTGFFKVPGGSTSTGGFLKFNDGNGNYWRFTGTNAGTFQTGEDADSIKNVPAQSVWQNNPDFTVNVIVPNSTYVQMIIGEYGGTVIGSDQVLVSVVSGIDNTDNLEKVVNGLFYNWTGVPANAINTKWDCQRIAGTEEFGYGFTTDQDYIHSGTRALEMHAGENTTTAVISLETTDTSDALSRNVSLWAAYDSSYTSSNLGLILINDIYGANTQYYDFVAEEWVNGTTFPPSNDCVKMLSITNTLTEFTVTGVTGAASNKMVPILVTGGTGITFSKVYVDDIVIQTINSQSYVPALGLQIKTAEARSLLKDTDSLLQVTDSTGRVLLDANYDGTTSPLYPKVVLQTPDRYSSNEAGVDLHLQAGAGYEKGGDLFLKNGHASIVNDYINGADIYLVTDYANKNGTNRDGRVYLSTHVGETQPSIQMWADNNSGVISGYMDYSGSETPLTLMGAAGFPGSNHNGRHLGLFAGQADGSGTDGEIRFGRISRDSVSYLTEDVGMKYALDNTDMWLFANERNNSNGRHFTIKSSPGLDSEAVSRNGGNLNFFAGTKANAGDDGRIQFGWDNGTNEVPMLNVQFSDSTKGDSVDEVFLMGSVPTTDKKGNDIFVLAQQGFDSGATARDGGNLILGAGKGINGGNDGSIGFIHQVADETNPITGLGFTYDTSTLMVMPLEQNMFGSTDYSGFDVKIIGGNADQNSAGDYNGGDIILGGGQAVNDGVLGKVRAITRFSYAQGDDVASANNLSLGYDGNVFEITGTTEIQLLSNVGWVNGSEVTLLFTSTPTVKHAITTSGTDITILLAGAVDFSATAGDVLKLVLCEIGGTQAWREVSRTTI